MPMVLLVKQLVSHLLGIYHLIGATDFLVPQLGLWLLMSLLLVSLIVGRSVMVVFCACSLLGYCFNELHILKKNLKDYAWDGGF